MAISYNRMWKLLVDKKMSKADLRKAADIAPNTMTKLRRDEPVNLAILGRICDVLKCDYGLLNGFIHMGAIAMTGFFLLSGYAITLSLQAARI